MPEQASAAGRAPDKRVVPLPVAEARRMDAVRRYSILDTPPDGAFDRDPGLCASAILRDDTLVIPGTLTDPVACANPLVTGPLGVRFYAAAPIITADGHRLGTVNVLDDKPRSITQDDTATLADLAAIVMDELELRLPALHAVRHEQEKREAESGYAEAEHRRAETEQAAREQAEKDSAAIAAFTSTLQRTLLPPASAP
ncbi:MAG: sle [Actinoallomurus sp.]|jgi:sigma-B regulation protein RsbU (phosphoserine phosphatase)|nr:sle [Actinoallomurus sp.]